MVVIDAERFAMRISFTAYGTQEVLSSGLQVVGFLGQAVSSFQMRGIVVHFRVQFTCDKKGLRGKGKFYLNGTPVPGGPPSPANNSK